jgi:hypothetical protein
MVALALALVVALTLAACGGGGEDATKVLNQTFSGGKKVRSGKLNLALTFSGQGVPQLKGPVSVKLNGPFQSSGTGTLPQFDFSLALGGGGQSFAAGAISTGDNGFLKFQGQTYAVPPNVFASFKQGYEQAQKQAQQKGKQNTSLSSLGIDPRDWLKDPKTEDDVDVEGTKTTHVSAGVDVGKLLNDVNKVLQRAGGQLAQNRQLPTSITPQQRKTIEDAIKDAKFDVYSGKDDHILRRMTVKLKFEVPEKSRAQANGLKGGDLNFDLTLASLNQPQTIAAPTGARPFSELTAKLRSSLGGLGGGGASTGGGSTGGGSTGGTAPSGAGNANAQRYLQCLQQAGGDVSKAQKCAALLNG